MPTDAMFPGGYRRVFYRLAGGLTPDDIEFFVGEGPEAGAISPSKDATWDDANPHIMLLAGSRTGTFTLVVTHAATGDTLAKVPFDVSTEWADDHDGPPLAFVGESQPWVTGGAWGGGPAGVQNVNVMPASGVRRVGIVLVDTSSSRLPTTGTTTADIRTIVGQRGRRDDARPRRGAAQFVALLPGGLGRAVRRLPHRAVRSRGPRACRARGPTTSSGTRPRLLGHEGQSVPGGGHGGAGDDRLRRRRHARHHHLLAHGLDRSEPLRICSSGRSRRASTSRTRARAARPSSRRRFRSSRCRPTGPPSTAAACTRRCRTNSGTTSVCPTST